MVRMFGRDQSGQPLDAVHAWSLGQEANGRPAAHGALGN